MSLATGNGVGVFENGNDISFVDCAFNYNNASSGGAIYVSGDNSIAFSVCTFVENSAVAGVGAAIFADQENRISLSATNISGNTALLSGGGIATTVANSLFVTNSSFTLNTAGTVGGGISIEGNTLVHFYGANMFSGNKANFGGGAIACIKSPIWFLALNGSISLEGNVAGVGSALLFKSVVSSVHYANSVLVLNAGITGDLSAVGESSPDNVLHDMFISRNVANIGGTVYWIYDQSMLEEPAGLRSSSIVWEYNVAPYGTLVATQAVFIMGPTDYEVTVYETSLSPPLIFKLYDFYQSFLPLDGVTSVVASISNASFDCHAQSRSLTGSDMFADGVQLSNGSAVFSSLEASCSPLGYMSLDFEARLGDEFVGESALLSTFYITNSTVLNFRSCISGEKYTSRACEVCASGSYSLEENSLLCTNCVDISGIDDCYSNQIFVSSGYWRRYPYTTAVMKCRYARSCIGGNGTGDSLCAQGYEGPLCSVCSAGYFGVDDVCIRCSSSHFMTPTLIGYVCMFSLVLLVALLAVWYKYYYFVHDIDEDDDEDIDFIMRAERRRTQLVTSDGNSPQLSLLQRVLLLIRENFVQITSKVKIAVSTLQIVISTGTVLVVSMPGAFTSWENIINFLNFNISSALPLSCSGGNYDFISHLVLSTLAPIAVTGLFVIVFTIEYSFHRKNIQKNKFRRRGDKVDYVVDI